MILYRAGIRKTPETRIKYYIFCKFPTFLSYLFVRGYFSLLCPSAARISCWHMSRVKINHCFRLFYCLWKYSGRAANDGIAVLEQHSRSFSNDKHLLELRSWFFIIEISYLVIRCLNIPVFPHFGQVNLRFVNV